MVRFRRNGAGCLGGACVVPESERKPVSAPGTADYLVALGLAALVFAYAMRKRADSLVDDMPTSPTRFFSGDDERTIY